jgi:hypothetical protein
MLTLPDGSKDTHAYDALSRRTSLTRQRREHQLEHTIRSRT